MMDYTLSRYIDFEGGAKKRSNYLTFQNRTDNYERQAVFFLRTFSPG
jgi:hypothetical protein